MLTNKVILISYFTTSIASLEEIVKVEFIYLMHINMYRNEMSNTLLNTSKYLLVVFLQDI